tara:strand:+ start:773 stop:1726 length:954 start_codon:yes stop_codon:yes gene_type:complete
LLFFIAVLPGCSEGPLCLPSGASLEPDYEVRFQSGFGGSVEVIERESRDADIVGNEEGLYLSDWQADLEGGPTFGDGKLFFEAGNRGQRDVNMVDDPADASNRVMQFWIGEPHVPQAPQDKARIQLGIRNNEALRTFRYSVKVRLAEGFSVLEEWGKAIHWLTLAEFWNNAPAEEHTFRVTLNLNKEQDGPLLWNSHAQTQALDGGPWTDVWESRNGTAPVPLDEWFTIEVELREGCAEDGLYRVDLVELDGTRHELMAVRGSTHHPRDPAPDGFRSINPLKLYTSGELVNYVKGEGEALRVLWDDLSIATGSAAVD